MPGDPIFLLIGQFLYRFSTTDQKQTNYERWKLTKVFVCFYHRAVENIVAIRRSPKKG